MAGPIGDRSVFHLDSQKAYHYIVGSRHLQPIILGESSQDGAQLRKANKERTSALYSGPWLVPAAVFL
jgi:hypothetical protein